MKSSLCFLALILLTATGCQVLDLGAEPTVATQVVALPSVTPSQEPSPTDIPTDTPVPATVPPTWTLPPTATATRKVTALPAPSMTPRPTNSPFPTLTTAPTSTPTPIPTPTVNFTATEDARLTATAAPSATPAPTVVAIGTNLLPNPSFEGGWYHVSGIAELQVPQGWFLGWQEGQNDLDPDPWNVFVRPESRVLSGDFLPANEHDLFIWDGQYTVKVFKRTGALYFWLATNVQLQPGTYVLEINVFPDMVDSYTEGGAKIWAPDPLSAELRFIHDGEVGNWIFPVFGQKNTFQYTFQVVEPAQVRLGAAFRGRWAILNNGWFFDDWSLTRIATDS